MPSKAATNPKLDQDNAWKEMLDRHFQEFMEFFFAEIHAAMDARRDGARIALDPEGTANLQRSSHFKDRVGSAR